MGYLNKFNLKTSLCNAFVETGTGGGKSLKHAYFNGGFKKLFSVEAFKDTALAAQAMFQKYRNVEIINDTSEAGLHRILPGLNSEDRVLFFLDAHFVGEMSSSFQGYQSNVANDVNLPLRNELKLIRDYRPNSNDIIIVDDLRLYEDGPYANGNVPPNYANIPPAMRNIDFVYEIFGDRKIIRNFDDEGYLLILPEDSQFTLKKLSFLQYISKKLLEKLFSLGVRI